MLWPIGEYAFLVSIQNERHVWSRNYPDEQVLQWHMCLIAPESYDQIVEVTVSYYTVSQGSPYPNSSDQKGAVDKQKVERPENTNRLHSLKPVCLGKSENSGPSSQDETERIDEVLMSQIRELVTRLVEKIVRPPDVSRLSCSVSTTEGY